MMSKEIISLYRAGGIRLVILMFVLVLMFFVSVTAADSGNVSVYKGAFSGEWSGEVNGMAINGIFSVSISADGNVSGAFSGFVSGTISGTVNASGEIKAQGSAGLGEWVGNLSVSGGRLSGNGEWKGYGGGGTWSSK